MGTQGEPPKGNSCPKSPNKKHDWISDYVYVDFTHDSIATIVINPKIDAKGKLNIWNFEISKFNFS